MRPLPSFVRSFWIGALLAGAGLALALHLGWRKTYAKLPPPPPIPIPEKAFVANYQRSDSPTTIDRLVFHNGLWGFRERMERTDLLLLGSSHPLFGLSARELEEKLSTLEGRPVRVFNAALPGTTCGATLLEENGLRGKRAVVDLFAMRQGTSSSEQTELLSAWWTIGKTWTNFLRDRSLDFVLPRYEFSPTGPLQHPRIPARRYLGSTLCRDWETGDVVWYWTRQGYLYPVPHDGGNAEGAVHPYPDFPNAGITGNEEKEAYARTETTVWYTLIPFSGFRGGRVPDDATPFLPIAPEGLRFYDTHHLTGPARSLATERLFEELREALRAGRIAPFTPSR